MLSSSERKRTKLLIDINAILDTRLGAVRLLNPEAAESLKQNQDYYTRDHDNLETLCDIDKNEFTSLMVSSPIEILDNSVVSHIYLYIKKMITVIRDTIGLSNPIIPYIDIELNTYPFQLSEEQSKYIAAGLSALLDVEEKVTPVYLPYSGLTLDYFDTNEYFMFIVYDFSTWAMSALPDKKGETLEEVGLKRCENFSIVAPNIILDKEKAKEVEFELNNLNLNYDIRDVVAMSWNLLFEFEVLDLVHFTEFNPEVMKRLMEYEKKSNSPIDIEVDLVSQYHEVINYNRSLRENINTAINNLQDNVSELKELVNQELNEDQIKECRIKLARNRFLTDLLSYLIPSNPSDDFESYYDSLMTQLDTSEENAKISEEFYNDLGIPCKLIIRTVPELDRKAYILYCAETVTDVKGVVRKKGEHLPSVMAQPPFVTDTQVTQLKRFLIDIKE